MIEPALIVLLLIPPAAAIFTLKRNSAKVGSADRLQMAWVITGVFSVVCVVAAALLAISMLVHH